MRNYRKIAIIFAILVSFNPAFIRAQDLLGVVKTENGMVSGVISSDYTVMAYKGIPYAAPPVGDLRWKAPQPADSWEGVKVCDHFSTPEVQPLPGPNSSYTHEFNVPFGPLSEDCLYLNVWTAAKSSEEKRPVIVHIHGGAFLKGSGSVPLYDGEEMAKKGVVFVNINYRLGIFGFFAHPELTAESSYGSSGNYGLLDQIAAIKWVKRNIKTFGGDPDNITIAGQSAGAMSVSSLVASPLCRGLFQRAIAQSGASIMQTGLMAGSKTLKNMEEIGLSVMKDLNASSIEELRQVPGYEFLKVNTSFWPITDGYVLPTDLYTIFSEGQQNDIPVILGWNEDEGFGAPMVDAKTFRESMQKEYGQKADEFFELFPASNEEEAKQSQTVLNSLSFFPVQAYAWVKIQNKTGKSPVYIYHFTHDIPFGIGQRNYGAFHSSELAYVYNNLKMSEIRPWKDVDYQLANTMSSYWANFAKAGNPNGDNLPIWEPSSAETFKVIFLQEKIEMKAFPYKEQLQFLEKFYGTQMENNK